MTLKSCDLDPIPIFIMNCQFSDNQDYQAFNGIWSTFYWFESGQCQTMALLKKQSLSSDEFEVGFSV